MSNAGRHRRSHCSFAAAVVSGGKRKKKFLVSDSIPLRDEIERLEKVIKDLVPIIKCLNDPKGKKGSRAEQSRAEQSRKIRRKGYWICPFSWASLAIGWPRRSS
jgi:hypothetical protein